MPKDPHITGGIRHDWKAIKHEYVTNPDMSLKKVAAKYGVNVQTVYKKSKAEGWVAARKKHQEKVVAKAIAKTGRLQAKELAQEAEFLKLMKGHMERMLKDEEQFQRHIVEEISINEEEGKVISTSETVFNKFDSRAMKDAMQVLQMIESMTRSLYNLQKAEQLQKHQIDSRRLEIEEERLELDKDKADAGKTSNDLVIRIEGFEEGWDE